MASILGSANKHCSSSQSQTQQPPSSSTFFPPPHFSYLEENLCHCFAPLHKAHISYLNHIGVQRILNFSGQKLDANVLIQLETFGIHHINDISIGDEFEMSDIAKFEEWLALAVEDIISHSSHAATLIVGSCETFLDCVVLACWRRVQQWSIMNIISEFRMYTWPHKLYDYEQLIERFNTSLVDVISLSPEFFVIHSNLQEEEHKLIERYRMIKENAPEEDDDQDRIDRVLFNLFFDKHDALISKAVKYDPSVSLVNDKDDDD